MEPDQAAKLVVVTGTPLSDCGAVSARGLLGIEKMFDALGAPMKGDRVEIVVDDGGGNRTYEVAATRAGRRVEVLNRRGFVEVSEVTRNGTPVRTARFMATRIIALVEYPATDQSAGGDRGQGGESP